MSRPTTPRTQRTPPKPKRKVPRLGNKGVPPKPPATPGSPPGSPSGAGGWAGFRTRSGSKESNLEKVDKANDVAMKPLGASRAPSQTPSPPAGYAQRGDSFFLSGTIGNRLRSNSSPAGYHRPGASTPVKSTPANPYHVPGARRGLADDLPDIPAHLRTTGNPDPRIYGQLQLRRSPRNSDPGVYGQLQLRRSRANSDPGVYGNLTLVPKKPPRSRTGGKSNDGDGTVNSGLTSAQKEPVPMQGGGNPPPWRGLGSSTGSASASTVSNSGRSSGSGRSSNSNSGRSRSGTDSNIGNAKVPEKPPRSGGGKSNDGDGTFNSGLTSAPKEPVPMQGGGNPPPRSGLGSNAGNANLGNQKKGNMLSRNPKRTMVGVGVFIGVVLVSGGVIYGPYLEADNRPSIEGQSFTLELKDGKADDLSDFDLMEVTTPGSTRKIAKIDPSGFTLALDADGNGQQVQTSNGKSLSTEDGTWTVSNKGKLSFEPAPNFDGKPVSIFICAQDKSFVYSEFAEFGIEYTVIPVEQMNELPDLVPLSLDAQPLDSASEQVDLIAANPEYELPEIRFELFFPMLGGEVSDPNTIELMDGSKWILSDNKVKFDPADGFEECFLEIGYRAVDSQTGAIISSSSVAINFRHDLDYSPRKVPSLAEFEVSVSCEEGLKRNSVEIAVAKDGTYTRDEPLSRVDADGVVTGQWTVKGNKLLYSPVDAEFAKIVQRNPPGIYMRAKDKKGKSLDPIRLSFELYLHPLAAPDKVETKGSDTAEIRVLVNDNIREMSGQNTRGKNIAQNEADPASIHFSSILNGMEPVEHKIEQGGKRLTIIGEGVWSAERKDGKIRFDRETGFTGVPTPVTYSMRDLLGSLSTQAGVFIDRNIDQTIGKLRLMANESDRTFWKRFDDVGSSTRKALAVENTMLTANQIAYMFEPMLTAAEFDNAATLEGISEDTRDEIFTNWRKSKYSVKRLIALTALKHHFDDKEDHSEKVLRNRVKRLFLLEDILHRYVRVLEKIARRKAEG